jgi:hypothetical protein
MGRVRINLNEQGLGNLLFNNLMTAFKEENNYSPDAYDGYYKRQTKNCATDYGYIDTFRDWSS